ncbi:hypothetical protein BVX95_00435 [archaeon D22]|nr:hypothetical protein BVX95_00435 [archaeon D22]
MKMAHEIAVIPGDLNGITVTEATLKIVEALGPKLKKEINHTTFKYDAEYFIENNITELGDKELGELKKYDQIFLGAIGNPNVIKPGILEIGILLKIRQAFDQYVNLRPIALPEGVPSVIVGKGSDEINFEICRENSEGLYVDEGHVENEGTDEEVAYQVMRCSYRGVKRLAEYAKERAKLRNKKGGPKVHFVFKTNVLLHASSPWNRVMKELKEEGEVQVEYMHVDNFGMQMIIRPEQFDVVITENMFGDIMTDIGAVIQGGIGTAVSGNINPTGEFPGMFEPLHGTAPDRWFNEKGEKDEELIQTVKCEAATLSYSMMLEQIGEVEAAALLKEAALNNIRNPNYKTMKLNDLVDAAINYIKSKC